MSSYVCLARQGKTKLFWKIFGWVSSIDMQNLWCKTSWNPECCLLIITMLMVTHTKGIWKKPFENINLSVFVTGEPGGWPIWKTHTMRCRNRITIVIHNTIQCCHDYYCLYMSPIRHRDWWSARQQYHTHRGEQLGRNGSHYIRRRWVFELQHLKSRLSHKTETAKKTLIFHIHYNFFLQLQLFFQQFHI